MIGLPEMMVIVIIAGAVFFFGKGKVLDWAKGFGEVKQEYEKGKQVTTKNA